MLDARWPFDWVRSLPAPDPGSPPLAITPSATYLIGRIEEPPAGAELLEVVGNNAIYYFPQSPYYAATVNSSDPPRDASYAWRLKTAEASARLVSSNVIEVRASPAGGQDRLLVLESFHPGWRLEIDGQRTDALDNYGGFLSARALSGEHTYTFVFDPASFRYGAAVTAGTLLGAILLLLWRYVASLKHRRTVE